MVRNVACEPGHYYTEDLGSARVAFHTKGLCPQVQLNSSCIPKALRMKTSAGSVVIHKLGSDASVCQAFSTEFEVETGTPLPWMGGSLASLLFRAFETTMKPRRSRKQLTEEERQSLWEVQGSTCKLCGCTGAPKEHWEIDHVAPLCVGGGDTPDILQILCKACHAQKTQLETLSFVEESNPLLSRFSMETDKAFVQSPKPPTAGCQPPRKKGRSDLSRR